MCIIVWIIEIFMFKNHCIAILTKTIIIVTEDRLMMTSTAVELPFEEVEHFLIPTKCRTSIGELGSRMDCLI